MGNDPIVSIIVPVYNVQRYLNRCMDTLTNQTEKDIEIILVDDGSKDKSGEMCDQWAERDARIRVLHKENEGLGYARNSGIRIAKGKYIAYVDSDDYLEVDAIEKVVARLEETEADVCYFGCIDVWKDKRAYGTPPQKLLYEGDETIKYVKNILGPPPESTAFLFGGVSAWSGIVKRQLLVEKNILFPSERECLCEDIFYNIEVCINCKRIAIEPSCLYCYWHDDNDSSSLTTRYRADRFEAALRMYDDLNRKLQCLKYDPEIDSRIGRALMQNLIVCLKQEVVYEKINGTKHMKSMVKRIVNDPTVIRVLKHYTIHKMPIKQRLLFWAIQYQCYAATILLLKMKMKH